MDVDGDLDGSMGATVVSKVVAAREYDLLEWALLAYFACLVRLLACLPCKQVITLQATTEP